MQSFTGNIDVDRDILLTLEDTDLENLCHTTSTIHQLYDNDLWYHKILQLYPDMPYLTLNVDETRALYYKLKYNQWTDIIYFVSDHPNLLNWALNQTNYHKFVEHNIWKKFNQINNNRARERKIIFKDLLIFLLNHKFWVDKEVKFKSVLLNRLNFFKENDLKNKDLYNLYLQIFND